MIEIIRKPKNKEQWLDWICKRKDEINEFESKDEAINKHEWFDLGMLYGNVEHQCSKKELEEAKRQLLKAITNYTSVAGVRTWGVYGAERIERALEMTVDVINEEFTEERLRGLLYEKLKEAGRA